MEALGSRPSPAEAHTQSRPLGGQWPRRGPGAVLRVKPAHPWRGPSLPVPAGLTLQLASSLLPLPSPLALWGCLMESLSFPGLHFLLLQRFLAKWPLGWDPVHWCLRPAPLPVGPLYTARSRWGPSRAWISEQTLAAACGPNSEFWPKSTVMLCWQGCLPTPGGSSTAPLPSPAGEARVLF